MVKMQNFSRSKNTLRCSFLLALAGVAEKSTLTDDFLSWRVAEYEALQIEIEQLKSEIPNAIKRWL